MEGKLQLVANALHSLMSMDICQRASESLRNGATEAPRLHLKSIPTFTGDWKGTDGIHDDLVDSRPNMVSRLTKTSSPNGGWKSPQNGFYHRIRHNRLGEVGIPLKKCDEVLDLLEKRPLACSQLQRRQLTPTKRAFGFACKPRSETGGVKCVLAGPNHMNGLGAGATQLA